MKNEGVIAAFIVITNIWRVDKVGAFDFRKVERGTGLNVGLVKAETNLEIT